VSNTDSFIDEVTEEVRRDKLFARMRRYGWIAVVAVLLLVGGAAYNEWNKARERAAAQALGDNILAALERDERAARADALAGIDGPTPGADAVVTLLAAGEEIEGAPAEAAARLLTLADRSDVPQIYRQIATLKAVSIAEASLDVAERRERLVGLTAGGGLIRLLAEEQLAYLDIETGDTEAAIGRLEQINADAEATQGLRRRVSQVILALGGEIDPARDAG